MVEIIWTELAIEDLESIHPIFQKDSKVYADRQVDKIIDRVDQIGNIPKSGSVVPEFNSELIRDLIEGNYRIIYKINSLNIGIVRIHYAAKQLK